MDRFRQIDWNPPLEDLVDNIFVDEEVIKDRSVMYRIINGSYKNPFADMHTDYKNVNIDAIDALQPKTQPNNENTEDKQEDEEENCLNKKKKSRYTPGLVKPSFKFPRLSSFTKSQQAMCLRVFVRFSSSQKPELSQTDREEIEAYLALKDEISKEQDEYLAFAKSKWTCNNLYLVCEEYMNSRWKAKVNSIKNLHRYYGQVTNVPFVGNNHITVKHVSTCSTMGHVKPIKLPKLEWPCILNINSAQLHEQFPLAKPSKNSLPCFKFPVSEDAHCQNIVETNAVDLVISSSGLNCLANNIGPKYTNSWILSVRIKSENGRNVVYIDKPIPPSGNTILDKNKWIYKYIVRYFMVYRDNLRKKRSKKSYEDVAFDDITAEKITKLEEEHSEPLPFSKSEPIVFDGKNDNDNSISEKIITDDTSTAKPETSNTENLEETSSARENDNSLSKRSDTSEREKCQKSNDRVDGNASYNIFSIGPEPSEQSELMKNNTGKEYKILVRTKVDGFEKLAGGTNQNVLLVPKLEHQVALGAEAVTLEEAMEQWISLIFRPHTVLARVRIWTEKSEVLQIERRTSVSISNEIKRLHNVRAEDALTVLYNTTQSLINLLPGHYLMRHTPRDGAFATIYKETDGAGKNDFDLHTMCQSEYYTIPNSPWPPLDKVVVTPLHRHFERMPATFYPLPDKFKKNKKSKKPATPKGKMGNKGGKAVSK